MIRKVCSLFFAFVLISTLSLTAFAEQRDVSPNLTKESKTEPNVSDASPNQTKESKTEPNVSDVSPNQTKETKTEPNVNDASPNQTKEPEPENITDAIKPIRHYTTEVKKTYRLPETVKQAGDSYQTTNSKVITVDKVSGNFKTISDGVAYIVITNGTEVRYLQITVGTGVSLSSNVTDRPNITYKASRNSYK